MTRGERREVPVPRTRYSVYLKRGRNLIVAAEASLESANWDAASVAAVQGAISLGDALSVSKLGRRSRGQDHREVLTLLREVPLKKGKEVSRLLGGILATKAEVEYSDRENQEPETRRLAAQARRLLELVSEELS